ncbi:MAG: hypothetical protein BJ554DRAFT_7357 [Olpidium bornovanus]|uniref:Uncharacterized protein n=1 Tax=Olpidium bornovanus TaxID=278681 RepID=A0A8H7ZX25_9FUNG|nr:MAG: hypothetical protein BJ554DRAFT_7357 [Olpidium bornovanus]
MCCSGAKWKKETVHDHKFDFVDVNDFVERSCVTRLKHSFIFLLVLKSTLVYFADLYTVTSLFVFSDRWRASGVEPAIPYQASRIIYSFCISASLLLLAWDALNALQIIRSGDIGLAFTSPFAYKCYVLRSYPHYCFFSHISDSKKATDELAFFVFFTLKGWKRMMFAEAPRQMVAGLTLHAFLTEQTFNLQHPLDIIRNKPPQYTSFLIMLFTFVVFLFSALLTLFAVVVYVPLLCRIQGNLKEYCCHKIDKRIGEILRKRSRRRFARAVKKQMIEALREAAPGSDTHDPAGPPKPTLPNVSIEEVCVYDEPIFADAGRAVGMQAECDSFGKYCGRFPAQRF